MLMRISYSSPRQRAKPDEPALVVLVTRECEPTSTYRKTQDASLIPARRCALLSIALCNA